MKQFAKKLKKAFTITELVIVIAVIAILAAVLIPTFSNVIGNAKKSAAMQTCTAAMKEYSGMLAGEGKEPNEMSGMVFVNDGYAYVYLNGGLQYLGKTGDLVKFDANGAFSKDKVKGITLDRNEKYTNVTTSATINNEEVTLMKGTLTNGTVYYATVTDGNPGAPFYTLDENNEYVQAQVSDATAAVLQYEQERNADPLDLKQSYTYLSISSSASEGRAEVYVKNVFDYDGEYYDATNKAIKVASTFKDAAGNQQKGYALWKSVGLEKGVDVATVTTSYVKADRNASGALGSKAESGTVGFINKEGDAVTYADSAKQEENLYFYSVEVNGTNYAGYFTLEKESDDALYRTEGANYSRAYGFENVDKNKLYVSAMD